MLAVSDSPHVERKKLVKCKVRLLSLVQELAAKLDISDMLLYAAAIVKTCERLYRVDKSATVQKEAFEPMVEVLGSFERITEEQREALQEQLGVVKMVEQGQSKLYESLSAVQPSVRGLLMSFIGLLVQHFPNGFVDPDGDGGQNKMLAALTKVMVADLKQQINESDPKKRKNALIEGAFRGLTGIMVNFDQQYDPAHRDRNHSSAIFGYLLITIDPVNMAQLSRYAAPRAAFQLLAEHAGQFRAALCDRLEVVYNHLTESCDHKNADIRKDAYRALESFLKEVSKQIVMLQRDSDKNAKMQAKGSFKFLFEKFYAMLKTSAGSNRALSISIRGFGYLAAACRLLMTEKDLAQMFEMIGQQCEQLYSSSTGDNMEAVGNLPSYITAVASMLRQMSTLEPGFLHVLERLVIIQLAEFPKLHTRVRWGALLAIADVGASLVGKGEALGILFGKATYQGLLYVCACTSTDAAAQTNDIEAYVDLFRHLVSGRLFQKSSSEEVTPEICAEIQGVLYDEIVQNILQIISQLNLQTVKSSKAAAAAAAAAAGGLAGDANGDDDDDDDALVSDLIAGRQAVNPNDWTVLIVLVRFADKFFRTTPAEHFLRWLPVIVEQLTRLWAEPGHELVSGIYSLLRICIEIGDHHGYFDRAIAGADTNATRESTVVRLQQFATELQSLFRQFKGDLLASSVSFVLALPHRFVGDNLGAFVPAMTVALQLGLSYTPLAETAVNALERWIATLPGSVLQPHLPAILPGLEAYLVSRASVDSDDTGGFAAERRRRVRAKAAAAAARRRGARAAAAAGGGSGNAVEITHRVVEVLGKMGGQYSSSLADADRQVGEDAADAAWLSWDYKKHLGYRVPFEGGLLVNMPLDGLLPRITQLAQHSNDRQVKIAACEVLHSLVIYMTGKTAETNTRKLGRLFTKVFPVLLELACDMEKIAKQIFEPLVLQLIAWFAKNKEYESELTVALLSAIFDGLSHPENSALRDFSATCVESFVSWTIKQTSDKELRDNPSHIRSMLLRIYSLFADPGVSKRLGGALAVNSFYRVFREHQALVDQYSIEMLVVMVQSLRHADKDHSRDAAGETTKTAIEHILKMMTGRQGYSELLSGTSGRRRLPPGIEDAAGNGGLEGSDLTLEHLANWIFVEMVRPERLVREVCSGIFLKIAGIVGGSKADPKNWIKKKVASKSGASDLVAAIEQGMQLEPVCAKGKGKAKAGAKQQETPTLLEWLSSFEAALDVYNVIIGRGLLSPEALWASEKGKTTALWTNISLFIAIILGGDGAVAALAGANFSLGGSTAAGRAGTAREQQQMREKKTYVAVRILSFLHLIVRSNPKFPPAGFWDESIAHFIAVAVLAPSKLGFSARDAEATKKLPMCTFSLLEAVTASKHDQLNRAVDESFRKLLAAPATDLCKVFEGVLDPRGDLHLVQNLATGYVQLHAGGKLDAALKLRGSSIQKMAGELLDILLEWCGCPGQSPLSQHVCSEVFDLIVALELPRDKLLECLQDDTPLSQDAPGMDTAVDDVAGDAAAAAADGPDTVQLRRAATRNEVFHRKFGSKLHEYCARHAKLMVPALMKAAKSPVVMQALQGTLKFVKNTAKDPEWGSLATMKSRVANAACSGFEAMNFMWAANSTTDTHLEALSLLLECLSLASNGAVPALNDAALVALLQEPGLAGVIELLNRTMSTLSIPLPKKVVAIHLMRFVALLPESNPNWTRSFDRTQGSLRVGLMQQFPKRSDEYHETGPEPSPERHRDYELAMGAVLDVLALSGSWPILDMVAEVTCRDVLNAAAVEGAGAGHHAFEPMIQAKLRDFAIQPPSAEALTANLTSVFELTSKLCSPALPAKYRHAILQRVLIPMLESSSVPRLRTFFQRVVKEVVKPVHVFKDTYKMQKGLSEDELLDATGAVALIEVMFLRLPRADIRAPGVIEAAYCDQNPDVGGEPPEKHLLTAVVKDFKSGLKPIKPVAAEGGSGGAKGPLDEPNRVLRCAAYNALSKVIACTQDAVANEKFYTVYLIKTLNDSKIIDSTRQYTFEQPPGMAIQTHASRLRAMSTHGGGGGGGVGGGGGSGNATGFLSSQILSGSSLAGTVAFAAPSQSQTQADDGSGGGGAGVGAAATSSSLSGTQGVNGGASMMDVDGSDNLGNLLFADSGDMLDDDEMNRHECMSRLVSTIDKLAPPQAEQVDSSAVANTAEMPKWMAALLKIFQSTDGSVDENLKLFIGKLLVNRPAAFQNWCVQWYAPMMRLLIHMMEKKQWPLNYYVADMCVLMLEWSEYAIPKNEHAGVVQRLLKVLVKSMRHEELPVLKNNAKIVKMLIEKWTTLVHGVPCQLLYDHFHSQRGQDEQKQGILCGVYLLGSIAASELPTYMTDDSTPDMLTREIFYKGLVGNLLKESRTLYKPSAACIGAVLQGLAVATTNGGDGAELKIVVDECLETLRKIKTGNNKDAESRLIWCLFNICNPDSGYPELLDERGSYFLKQTLDMLPRVSGGYQNMTLQLACWRANTVAGKLIFDTLKGQSMIPKLVNNPDSELQLLMLQTLGAASSSLPLVRIAALLPMLKSAFSNHRNEQCRKQYFAVAALCHNRATQQNPDADQDGDASMGGGGGASSPEACEKIRIETLTYLREGLADESSEVRALILEHWSKPSILGTAPDQRLVSMMDKLYHHNAEPEFLPAAAFSMLELCTESPLFNEPLFEEPLDECSWTAVSIDNGWHGQLDHMAPLFAATQFGSMVDGGGSFGAGGGGSGAGGGVFASTQSVQFGSQGFVRATQDVGGGGGRFQMTQSFAAGGLASMASQSQGGSSQSFSDNSFFQRKRKAGPESQGVGGGSSQSLDGGSATQSMHSKELYKLKRRFVSARRSGGSSSRSSGSHGGSAAAGSSGSRGGSKGGQAKSEAEGFRIATLVDAKRKRLEKQNSNRKRAKINTVQIRRKYRVGELPDVQIKHKELITPLQALALKDSVVAQLVFTGLFRGVYDALDKTPATKTDLTSGLVKMLKPEGPANALFTTAVLDLCTHVNVTTALPDEIAARSMASGALHAGVLLLENIVSVRTATAEQAEGGRRRGGFSDAAPVSVPELVPYWVALAKLYQNMDERDVSQGIFGSSLVAALQLSGDGEETMAETDSNPLAQTQKALDLESQGDLDDASKLYGAAVSQANASGDGSMEDTGLTQFWKDAQVSISERLCQWDVANTQLLAASQIPTDSDSWVESFWSNQAAVDGQLRPLLFGMTQLFLGAKVNAEDGALAETKSGQHLQAFINAGIAQPSRRQLLQSKHADLLTLTFTKGSARDTTMVAKARGYAHAAIESFVSEWPLMHPLMRGSRLAALQTLQPLVEAQEYLQLANAGTALSAAKVTNLLAQWNKRLPKSGTDEMSVWECVGANRLVLIDGFKSMLQLDGDDPETAGVRAALTRGKVQGLLLQAKEAALQRNSTLASESIVGAFAIVTAFKAENSTKDGNGADVWNTPSNGVLYNDLAFDWSCIRARNQLIDANRMFSISNISSQAADKALEKAAGSLYLCNNYANPDLKMDAGRGRASVMEDQSKKIHLLSLFASGLWNVSKIFASTIYSGRTDNLSACTPIMMKKKNFKKVFKGADTMLPADVVRETREKCLKHLLDATAPGSGWDRRHDELQPGLLEYAPSGGMMTGPEDGDATAARCNPPLVDATQMGAATVDELMNAHVTLAQFADELLSSGSDSGDGGGGGGGGRRGGGSVVKAVQAAAAAAAANVSYISWSDSSGSAAQDVDLRGIMIENALQGMRLGSSAARQLFPKLLRYVGERGGDALSERFAANAAQVPCWAFLAWLPQVIALLDTPKAKWLQGILTAIGKEYPNALVLPMTISVPGLQFKTAAQKDDKLFAERLRDQLAFEPLSSLIWELERLTHPMMVVSDWRAGELEAFFGNKKATKKDAEELYLDIKRRLTDDPDGAAPGTLIKEFRKKSWKGLEKIIGVNGKNLVGGSFSKMNKAIRALHGDGGTWKCPDKMALYSPWLAGFQSSNYTRAVEMPGQYDGASKPRPETHAKIDSFATKVMVMASMRKPKAITVRCNDGRSFKLLVKGGEDLRLDQRVEQVFAVMNDAMAADPDCARRKLNLRTYQVMPMTDRIGMIEWVDNTIVLKNMMLELGIEDPTRKRNGKDAAASGGAAAGGGRSRGGAKSSSSASKSGGSSGGSGTSPAALHKKWIDKYTGGYLTMLKSAGRKVVVDEQWVAKLKAAPQHSTLQVALQKLASGPEAYLTLKTGFVRSLATLNMCQYLLGIGDRHTSNTMVDATTGELVGIDFGHAFGSATELLPVPELMPFRLSPQLVKVMEPHGTSGLFRCSMMHVLRTLKENKDVLVATCEVFVNEPLLDWELRAKKDIKAGTFGNDVDVEEGVDLYSTNKLETISQKLNGCSPVWMTQQLVAANARFKADSGLLKATNSILDGSQYDARCPRAEARNRPLDEAHRCATTYDQVDVLIELGTDPNILGRTWVGWAPWL